MGIWRAASVALRLQTLFYSVGPTRLLLLKLLLHSLVSGDRLNQWWLGLHFALRKMALAANSAWKALDGQDCFITLWIVVVKLLPHHTDTCSIWCGAISGRRAHPNLRLLPLLLFLLSMVSLISREVLPHL